jgi:hypothetical protein
MAGILNQLCEAYMASPDGKARLDCGCLARPAFLIPCAWHRREFLTALLAACEDDVSECRGPCCDPG